MLPFLTYCLPGDVFSCSTFAARLCLLSRSFAMDAPYFSLLCFRGYDFSRISFSFGCAYSVSTGLLRSTLHAWKLDFGVLTRQKLGDHFSKVAASIKKGLLGPGNSGKVRQDLRGLFPGPCRSRIRLKFQIPQSGQRCEVFADMKVPSNESSTICLRPDA